jgi:hypothetical protein
MKKIFGTLVPVGAAALIIGVVLIMKPSRAVATGIFIGTAIALGESFASTGALLWAWRTDFFYWVWGGGLFLRLVVFSATAFIVYRYTSLNLIATLITLVGATTLFLVIESMAFLPQS